MVWIAAMLAWKQVFRNHDHNPYRTTCWQNLTKSRTSFFKKRCRLTKKLIKREQRKTCFHYAEREVFSRRQKPSGLIARTQLIMCCKTINNNFRNLSLLYLYPTIVHLRLVLLGAIRMVFVERSVFCAKHSWAFFCFVFSPTFCQCKPWRNHLILYSQ